MRDFTVIKRDHRGVSQLQYSGEIIQRTEIMVCIRAAFNFSERDLGYVVLKRGDIFTEWFYSDRWYNIFQINDVDSGILKGWYCNLTRPAQIENTSVAADDLALDIFVKPDGTTLILDEDELEALHLPEGEREQVWLAVRDIQGRVERREPPFDQISR